MKTGNDEGVELPPPLPTIKWVIEARQKARRKDDPWYPVADFHKPGEAQEALDWFRAKGPKRKTVYFQARRVTVSHEIEPW